MATSLPPVVLPVNTWVDLYAETGITVGVQVIVQNAGPNEALLTEAASSPPFPFDSDVLGVNPIPTKQFFTNVAGNVGAWALSKKGTNLQVEVA